MQIKASKKLDEIADILSDKIENQQLSVNSLGVYNGEFGILLFLLYYAEYSDDSRFASLAEKYAGQLLNKLPGKPAMHTFCGGLAGIMYLFEFLRENDFINIDISEVEEDFENYLVRRMEEDISINKYDFMHGALGVGLYFLKKNKRSDIVEKLIDFLYTTAEKGDNNKIFQWKSFINTETKEEGYNIALSHGMSSILIFLSRALKSGIENEKLLEMFHGTANYILQQEIDSQVYGCCFPNCSKETNNPVYKSRLAWCYGDLGVAMSLWIAGKAIASEEYKEKALEIFLYSTTRLSLGDNYVRDAELCHGSAGIAMIYNRMYKETKREEFRNAFYYWIGKTLDFSTSEDGIAGYQYYTLDGWEDDYCVLMGVSGIGLVLLSYLGTGGQEWDELFLLS